MNEIVKKEKTSDGGFSTDDQIERRESVKTKYQTRRFERNLRGAENFFYTRRKKEEEKEKALIAMSPNKKRKRNKI